ncbi:unnamed protein product [Kluyveromyces dobzhanskii CBS 2104]|uniref:WGS project CCBQ000000000 data, contig 00014 n=1 Tax=Kluyveromyces dobzhanskii CBS 2104 TaxID=1427455 RepID=A0A0A8L948_9SACH|nr:unnamed protein product [Kluyveromyces dobzhanskii CBS 2104]
MSLASEELNYLIWRYLQEAGHEVSALALQEETRVLEFEERFKEHIPLGCLVQLVRKGILYTESELLVPANGKVVPIDQEMYKRNFTLVQALEVDKQRFPEIVAKGRFALQNDVEAEMLEKKEQEHAAAMVEGSPFGSQSTSFIKTLSDRLTIPQSFVSQWNPRLDDMIVCGGANCQGKIAIIDTTTNKESWSFQDSIDLAYPKGSAEEPIICVSWSLDGELVITGTASGELRLWNKQGKLKNILDSHRSPIVAMKWNEDCTHLLTTDVSNVVILWSTLTGTQLQHFSFKEGLAEDDDSLGIDLEWIEIDKFVIPGPAGSLLVYTIGDNKPLGRLLGHTSTITTLQFNKSNKSLLSASDDDTIKVWKGGNFNAANNFTDHTKTISSANWVNDDLIITTSYDGTVKIWSVSQNSIVAEASLDSEPIFEASLSADKQWLAVGTLQGSVIVFDIKSFLASPDLTTAQQDPVPISTYGEYQIEQDGLQVTNLTWSKDSNAFAVSYINGNTTLLSL